VAIAVAAFAFATCGLVFTGSPFNGVGGFMAIASEIKDNICQKYHEDMMKEVLASQAKAEEKLAESAVHNASEEEPKVPEDSNQNVVSVGNAPRMSRVSRLAGRTMEKRKKHIQETCQRFADVMTPTSLLTSYLPTKLDNWAGHEELENVEPNQLHVHTEKKVMICAIPGVGSEFYRSFVMKSQTAGVGKSGGGSEFLKGISEEVERGLKNIKKKAIVVRHPLERLVSTYRKHFESYFDPKANKQVPAKASFQDFVDIVNDGYTELQKFIDDNKLGGQSLGIDTGMVDGLGLSFNWNPYWATCAVCHPNARPDLVLFADNGMEKDLKVLWEAMGSPAHTKDMLDSVSGQGKFKSADKDLLQHYYSQVSKSDIRKLAHKYQTDMELFGYDPEIFIQMGTD